MKKITLLITSILLASCVHRAPQLVRWTPLPFDEAEYNALPKTGTGIVKGQVFGRTVGGDVKKAAGESVILMPVTNYSNQYFNETAIPNHVVASAPDPRYHDYELRKTADGDGRFEFTNVPPGDYYVFSQIFWGRVAVSGGAPYTAKEGGRISRRITVSNGQTTDAILSLN